MFEHTSRYYKLKEAGFTGKDGRRIIYKLRRFLPKGEDIPKLAEVTVREDDRPDLVASRTVGDPLNFWKVCDANDCLNPFDMTSEPGRKLKVPNPQDK